MKICWDNIENIRLTKKGNFYNKATRQVYYYIDSCHNCGIPFLGRRKNNKYCDFECFKNDDKKVNPMKDRHHSEESKEK